MKSKEPGIFEKERWLKNDWIAYSGVLIKEILELEQENRAIRELMNVHNLGGWTDAIGPMKRALASEAKVLELEPYKAAWEAWLSLQTGDAQKLCDAAIQYKTVQNYVHRLMHSCPTAPEVVKIAIELNALTSK